MRQTKFLILCLLPLLLFSCKKKEEKKEQPDFDRKAMLTNIGNNIILPAYSDFSQKSGDLHAKVQDFNKNPGTASLTAVQLAFKNAFLSWEPVAVFGFGPAEQEALRVSLDVYPTDTAQINKNIADGSTNLDGAQNIDAKGFPAVDYLLFGVASDNAGILAKFTTDAQATNRKAYLEAIAAQISTKASAVSNAWASYLNTFVNASGTDVGSSVGILVNQLNYSFEMIKNNKIGIPLGKQTLGNPLPEKTEAYYSGISAQLAVKHEESILNIFLGGSGLGFDDYLTHLKANYNGGSLADAIHTQLSLVKEKLVAIPDPLSVAIVNNMAVVNTAYTELQKTVVLLKSDLSSALGVLITYQDNDGD